MLCPMARADEAPAANADTAYKAQIKALQDRQRALAYEDYAGKMTILREIAQLKRQHSGETSNDYLYALGGLAFEAYGSGRFDDEVPLRRQMLAICQARVAAAENPRVSDAIDADSPYDCLLNAGYNLADALDHVGLPLEAIKVLRPFVTDQANDRSALYAAPYERRIFTGADQYINKQLNRTDSRYAALVLRHGGDTATALFAASQAMLSVRLFRRNLGTHRLDEQELASIEQKGWADNFAGEDRFGDFARLYADAAWSANARDPVVTEDVFVALQDITLDRTTRALGSAAATRAARKHGAGALLAQRASLAQQSDALLKQWDDTRKATSGDMQDALFQRIFAIDGERDGIDIKLAAAAPEYFPLIRPQPLSIGQTRALLKPGEAALMVMPTEFGTHSMLVDQAGIAWQRSSLGAEVIKRHVRRLLWDVGGNVDVTPEEEARWTAEGTGQYPFDRTTAHLLYGELVAPLADRLKRVKYLYVIAGGSLSSLPFSLLVTAPPQGEDGDPAALRATQWFGDGLTLLQLPSLQSLQLLRAEEGRAPVRVADRLVGFGDPALDGEALDRGGGGHARATRSGAGMAAAGFQSSGDDTHLADPALLRTLSRLPGTARELTALQAAFGSDHSRIVLGDLARETAFKRTDLTHLSVLALSTHGLLAGEGGVASEPGLVFTPPVTATALDDGYLTSSEIAALDIDADWVILSACNTAAGDGSDGATGLSGLVRAFFFAGARSVLASHWPVKDAVAEKMIPLIVRLQREHPEWSRPEALQAAEKLIRDDPAADADLATWAHPSAWAPFAFIGDWQR